MQRAARIVGHIAVETQSLMAAQTTGFSSATKSPDDVVIVAAVRTAVCKAKRGGFKDTHPVELLQTVLKAVVERAGVKHEEVGDVIVGNVLAPGGFATQARMAMFLAGFPETVPITTVNRQCSSGLQAIANVAAAIKSGLYEVGIGAGVESMSQHDMMGAVGDIYDKVFENQMASQCLNSMGQTSEKVAGKFKISREAQDRLAVASNEKAIAAQKAGKFNAEIVPVKTKIVGKDGEEKEVTITADDGPRAGTTMESLGKLRPAFSKTGTTTAGNSSQVSDGAAAVMLMKRSKAESLGVRILGRFRGYSVVGVEPEIMGIGPAVAVPAVLKATGLKVSDIDSFEINEAFASQAVYCVEKIGIPAEKLNPNGGAIALGHPLGCTGARQMATILNYLKSNNKKLGVISMCIGTGMGAAAVVEAE